MSRKGLAMPVRSPKILSPVNIEVEGRQRSIGAVGAGGSKRFFPSQSNVSSNSNLGMNIKRNLSQSYGTHKAKNQKQAIRELHNEIQSAVLPDIHSSKSMTIKRRSLDPTKNRRSTNVTVMVENMEKEKKHTEYLHEEFYDGESKNKWTIFNKHAIEIKEPESDDGGQLEDQIVDEMTKMNRMADSNASNIPDSTWIALYEAKCIDLGIAAKSDKQLDRFIS